MADTPRLETSVFTSKAPERHITPLSARRRRAEAASCKSRRQRSGGSALAVLGVCMLCCALLLSSAFSDQPFVETMAVSAQNDPPGVRGDEVLGRLKFLFETVAEVFQKNDAALPVMGEVTAYYSDGHEYLELTGEAGCDVYAALSGTVEAVGNDEGGGYVVLAHENGMYTHYRALGTVCVEASQPVRAGDALGTSPSGRVFFSCQMEGEAVDPLSQLGLKAK